MYRAGSILSDVNRRRILGVARRTAAAYLGGGELPRLQEVFPAVAGGLFVTFWLRSQLRGCVGRFGESADLMLAVPEVTVSALRDERFTSNPIRLKELDRLTIEISILSPLQLVTDPLSITIGQHGIMITRGGASGCFLPQVAVTRGWAAEEFLSQCCAGKAGMPADAWRDSETRVYVFTAEVIREAESPIPKHAKYDETTR